MKGIAEISPILYLWALADLWKIGRLHICFRCWSFKALPFARATTSMLWAWDKDIFQSRSFVQEGLSAEDSW